MSVIAGSGIEKSYGARRVLAGVSLTLGSRERVGLVGRNGCGKSTLARILAGLETPDSGEVARRRGATVELLVQEPVLPADQTLRDIVLASLGDWSRARRRYDELTTQLGTAAGDTSALATQQAEAGETLERLGGWERLHEAEAVIRNLGIEDPTRLAGTLSGGERRRVALARVLVGSPSLAILDEPTNHLDVETIEWLEDHLLNRFRGALLLITHDRYVLDRVATRTLELEGGNLVSYDGGYATYLAARAGRQAHAERTERNRQNFLRRELEWLRRQPKARGTKAKARVDRAREALDQEAPRREREAELRAVAERQGKTVLEFDSVALDRGGKRLFGGLDLRVTAGQRIGVVGPNGAGKTTLLLAILGELEPSEGTVTLGANTKVGHLDQQRSGLDPDLTVFESLGERGAVETGGESLGVAAYLERFLFDRREQRVKVGQLSGGERARVCLARLLAEQSNLLLLDEPTNDLDVSTLAALETMLVEYAGSAIVVSHDRWFLDRVATSILAFSADGTVELHAGHYSDYRDRMLERKAAESAAAPPPDRAPSETKRARGATETPSRKLSYKEQRELDGLLDRIEASEADAARIEAELADPALYRRADAGAASGSLKQALADAQAQVEALTKRWEELETRRSASG
ncbi:MAG: ABC-F family ATP-binding cassette domain-containing protein [Myxococcales bacterium]|nr:ABC-F family ATP-binding cassette domain-containing protein [Myxococcales bacterium]